MMVKENETEAAGLRPGNGGLPGYNGAVGEVIHTAWLAGGADSVAGCVGVTGRPCALPSNDTRIPTSWPVLGALGAAEPKDFRGIEAADGTG
jgi:hypothetical protein